MGQIPKKILKGFGRKNNNYIDNTHDNNFNMNLNVKKDGSVCFIN